MQFGRKSPINHRKCESGNARHDVKVDRAVLLGALRNGGGNRRFDLASPAERPIHLGAIHLETLNLARLFFEQVICVCE
jgi:hypothetical protein